jgi:hypothetical protein
MQTSSSTHRHYLRHTTDIPVEIAGDTLSTAHREKGRNISFGGLAFISDNPLSIDQTVELSIHVTNPSFKELVRVAWCHPLDGGYEIGVEFLSHEVAYRARMVEQVCEIEQYRKSMQQRGRELTPQEAAIEWIEKYASKYPLQQE